MEREEEVRGCCGMHLHIGYFHLGFSNLQVYLGHCRGEEEGGESMREGGRREHEGRAGMLQPAQPRTIQQVPYLLHIDLKVGDLQQQTDTSMRR